MDINLLIILHLVSSSYMLGIIWFVQIVHYPLFKYIGTQQFRSYEQLHCNKTSYVVVPAMLAELVTALILHVYNTFIPDALLVINTVLILLIWLSTFAIQMPAHSLLCQNYCEKTINSLVRYNWIRTFLWSVRVMILVSLIYFSLNLKF